MLCLAAVAAAKKNRMNGLDVPRGISARTLLTIIDDSSENNI
jgi:hypothetical protein